MSLEEFEIRKKDHIRFSLEEKSQSLAEEAWKKIRLKPESFPEMNFEEVSLEHRSLGKSCSSPFFVSSMTGGHSESTSLNLILAEACVQKAWTLGVGSQRRELNDPGAAQEWKTLRQKFPRIQLASNIGLSQLIETPADQLKKIIDNTEASFLFIHTNPLQECLQTGGTPQFKGGLKAIERAVKGLPIPVVVKEVGIGISAEGYRRLSELGVAAVDVSGRGGTHWGRVEGLRAEAQSPQRKAAEVFKDWGLSTPEALYEIWKNETSENSTHPKSTLLPKNTTLSGATRAEVWASGGIRNGLQACQTLAMGAGRVGLARPILEAASKGSDEVVRVMEQFEWELKIAMFCLGVKTIAEFSERKVWSWEKI